MRRSTRLKRSLRIGAVAVPTSVALALMSFSGTAAADDGGASLLPMKPADVQPYMQKVAPLAGRVHLDTCPTLSGSESNLDDTTRLRTANRPFLIKSIADGGLGTTRTTSDYQGGAGGSTCTFEGNLVTDTTYPVGMASDNIAPNVDSLWFTQSTQVSREQSQTTGWSVNASLTAGTSNVSGGGGFTYNTSGTTTSGEVHGSESKLTVFPQGKTVRVEARKNGGWYDGYIVNKITVPMAGLVTTIYPARVFVGSPGASPVTWIVTDQSGGAQ
ncbi:hypothetical protein [Streptomyces sp. MS2.AVA.5]|uniref:Uncharacterized protein n=1 Tax=Streptomyces achmelvichensis TaxID=3134111 RepID=A0ACC6PLK4_9ACTN